MKKIIGTFTVLLVACGVFILNSKTPLDFADVTLSDIIASNIASAEGGIPVAGCRYTGDSNSRCIKAGYQVTNCVNNSEVTTCGI